MQEIVFAVFFVAGCLAGAVLMGYLIKSFFVRD